jgi:hypothetical protein
MMRVNSLVWQAAADFIRSPDTFQFDMLDSPAVQQLQSDPQDGAVFQLLSVLLAGDVQVCFCGSLNHLVDRPHVPAGVRR